MNILNSSQSNPTNLSAPCGLVPSIDNMVIKHRLYVNPDAKNVKKKHRSFSVKKVVAIAEEVDRLLEARFIQETQY